MDQPCFALNIGMSFFTPSPGFVWRILRTASQTSVAVGWKVWSESAIFETRRLLSFVMKQGNLGGKLTEQRSCRKPAMIWPRYRNLEEKKIELDLSVGSLEEETGEGKEQIE